MKKVTLAASLAILVPALIDIASALRLIPADTPAPVKLDPNA